MTTDLPYPIDKGSTHWEGCYRERRHHNCAVVEVDRLRAENERLREALRECADDLEAEVTARYPGDSLDYPVMQARYERDMGPVVRAREALEATDDS